METTKKFTDSLTFKGIVVAILALLLLIPSVMVQNLIEERQRRSSDTVLKINDKWSLSQTVCAPILVVPYTTTVFDTKNKPYVTEEHKLYITPKNLKIEANLQPEERHYGIFKAILYKSGISLSGNFTNFTSQKIENSVLHFDKAYIAIGVSDLRGITQNVDFKINDKKLDAQVQVGGNSESTHYDEVAAEQVVEIVASDVENVDVIEVGNEEFMGKTLIIPLKDVVENNFRFSCNLKLNGSSNIKFIPIGQTTNVNIGGNWTSPSFVGAFTPEYTIDKDSFNADWNILSFNRNIPEFWSDQKVSAYTLSDNAFGVSLIETIDHYQQSMRSAKYALMFILLTFVVFFFVEIFTKKPIHFVQYLLVGLALILFYSLLLSISEQLGFGLAYLFASVATISLISVYTYSIIKKCVPTSILAGVLIGLYLFLYTILQVEDLALLIGSLFLFIVLGLIMFVSNKIKWNKNE
ncbi:MAG: cell envelope integrity protein CreD [Prevotellaceae bacterium]|nr:cell envelope integrity protein CreD [Prevotellaceae bacterium]